MLRLKLPLVCLCLFSWALLSIKANLSQVLAKPGYGQDVKSLPIEVAPLSLDTELQTVLPSAVSPASHLQPLSGAYYFSYVDN